MYTHCRLDRKGFGTFTSKREITMSNYLVVLIYNRSTLNSRLVGYPHKLTPYFWKRIRGQVFDL
jgi:hypothetical protein